MSEGEETLMKSRRFWLSIKKASSCLYSRRNGLTGLRVCGLSICLRISGKDVL